MEEIGWFWLQHLWDWPEYWEEPWISEETCCHLDSNERPFANAGVKNSLEEKNNDTY